MALLSIYANKVNVCFILHILFAILLVNEALWNCYRFSSTTIGVKFVSDYALEIEIAN